MTPRPASSDWSDAKQGDGLTRWAHTSPPRRRASAHGTGGRRRTSGTTSYLNTSLYPLSWCRRDVLCCRVSARQPRPLLFRQKWPKPVTPRPASSDCSDAKEGRRANSRGSHKPVKNKSVRSWGRAAGVGQGKEWCGVEGIFLGLLVLGVFSWPPDLSSGKASVNVHTSAIHMEKLS